MKKIYFSDLELYVPENIYKPKEDTELLAENIEIKENECVLDIGTGSGVLVLIAAKNASNVLGVDIDEEAVKIANKNAKSNGIRNVEFKKSDLFKNIESKFDVIIFNPPYLPVENENKIWSGGKTGRKIIEKFAKNVKNYLKRNGRIYLVISSLTGVENVKKLFKEKGFKVKEKASKKIFWEKLVVFEIKNNNTLLNFLLKHI